jgi:hypothetical protein
MVVVVVEEPQLGVLIAEQLVGVVRSHAGVAASAEMHPSTSDTLARQSAETFATPSTHEDWLFGAVLFAVPPSHCAVDE